MGLFSKKKKREENIDEEVEEFEDDFSPSMPVPPPAPDLIRERLDEHPEDLFSPAPEPELARSFREEEPIKELQPGEVDKLLEEKPLPPDFEEEDIRRAIEEVKTDMTPEPIRVFLKPETVTMDDIEKEFALPDIETPVPEDFGIPSPIPRNNFKLPDVDDDLPDFESPFTPPRAKKTFSVPTHKKLEGEIFIRFDDYQKVSPKVKELQSVLNNTIRSLNAEVNLESSQLSTLGAFNGTLDHIQEKLMEVDGLMFKEE
ncbi:MAG: hypothetical protein ABIE94_06595 [archaeon]